MKFPAAPQQTDSILEDRLAEWHRQIDVLSGVEKELFLLEAQEKSKEAELYLNAQGKNIEEKKAVVYNSKIWREFAFELATAKAAYYRERRILEHKIKEYEAAYLTMKIEGDAIRKYPS